MDKNGTDGGASGMRMNQCGAKLSLILPDSEDGYPEVEEECEKRQGHRDYHGTLSGYGWATTNSDEPSE